MIKQEQIKQIREFLEKAQNPLFFFDNDVDGLASFLLLRRFCDKGKGIVIKSFPDLSTAYIRKIEEFKPDYIFVLDKPLIEKGFREAAQQFGIPLIWIDHHPIPEYAYEDNIHYFNPLTEGKLNEPVSYICYKIAGKKEDEWIAMIGCLSDWFVPDFAENFVKEYPELLSQIKSPAKALYETELGKIIKILSFALKDRTSNVVKMVKNLLIVKNPRELLDITSPKIISIHRRFNQINRRYEKILNKAKEIARNHKRLIFFQYGGDLSLSSEISNELIYFFPDRVVVVAYIKGTKANVSVRGILMNVRELTAKALEGIESTSGGHEHACGATLQVEDLPKFRDNLIKLLR
ncbi:MAG: DHH family phosphoesterase [Candidatus Pacearchaeota archaeon]|nr:DHH family phosphoesterase [Candidatus Pacearchaeota archaeon]